MQIWELFWKNFFVLPSPHMRAHTHTYGEAGWEIHSISVLFDIEHSHPFNVLIIWKHPKFIDYKFATFYPNSQSKQNIFFFMQCSTCDRYIYIYTYIYTEICVCFVFDFFVFFLPFQFEELVQHMFIFKENVFSNPNDSHKSSTINEKYNLKNRNLIFD